jgi:hypothetical protein
MAADFIIKAEHQVVFSYGWGTLTFGDVIDYRNRLSKDARFSPAFKQFIHLSNLRAIELSSLEIEQLAKKPLFAPESRRALFASSDLLYGLSRIFQAYSDTQNVAVFRGLDEALSWIDVPMEVANGAFLELRSLHDLA